ncbi:hypothetical protein FRC03_003396 [Tulasnella sp. 419]|nr:hypothetical protein FRC03_003396 [Tulasnella sp. 419]
MDNAPLLSLFEPGAIFEYRKLSDPDGPLESCREDDRRLNPSSGHFGIVKRCNVLDNQGNAIGRQVALKMLRVKMVSRDSNPNEDDLQTRMAKRLEREWSIHCKLEHRHIAPLLGSMEIPDQHIWFLVTPWYRNGTIRTFARSRPDQRFRLLFEATNGLSYLHFEQIVHGDIKSTNVLIDNGGRAVIIDFGVSFVAIPPPAELNSSNIAEAPQWLAPELQRANNGNVRSFKSDIWAYGCLILELYCDRNPFYDLQPGAVSHSLNNPDENKRLLPGSPERYPMVAANSPMWEVCSHCWKRDPDERPDIRGVISMLYATEGLTRPLLP